MDEPVAHPAQTSEVVRGDTPGSAGRTRYEDDLYTWVEEQVALLRAGRVDALDLEHIAEELSDVGIAQYHRLESALRVLIMHMLKWDQQPELRSRSWVATIVEQRSRIERLLRKNPGLKPRTAEAAEDAYGSAVRWAAVETGYIESDFPADQPYSWDDILNRPFDLDTDR